MLNAKFLVVLGFLPLFAHASVVVLGTRVVYPAQKKSINVQLTNNESSPSLIQSWIDDGDTSATPDSVRVPFIITPPIFRIEPKSGQTLRIIYTHEALPQDRESLFYLNVLDIPAKTKSHGEAPSGYRDNFIQLAVRNRIKFFFRPDNLKPRVTESYQNVLWRMKQNDTGNTLQADNKTPYFITYSSIALKKPGQPESVLSAGMIAPYSVKEFSLKKRPAPGTKISWVVINDYGGYQEGESILK